MGVQATVWPSTYVLFRDSEITHLILAHSIDLQSGTLVRVKGKFTNILTLLIGIMPSRALSVSFEV